MPSQKKTPPAMSLRIRIDFGPSMGGCVSQAMNLFMSVAPFTACNWSNGKLFPAIELFSAGGARSMKSATLGFRTSSGGARVRLRSACIAQRNRPPVQARQQRRHRMAMAVRLQQLAGFVELLPRARKADRVANGHGVQFGEYLAQLLYRAQAAGDTPIRNESHRLGVPLGAHRIDERLEWRRIAMVVLRRDDHECVGFGNALPQRACAGAALGIELRFEAIDGWIDRIDREASVTSNLFSGPCSHLVAEASFAGAAVDKRNPYFVVHACFSLPDSKFRYNQP